MALRRAFPTRFTVFWFSDYLAQAQLTLPQSAPYNHTFLAVCQASFGPQGAGSAGALGGTLLDCYRAGADFPDDDVGRDIGVNFFDGRA